MSAQLDTAQRSDGSLNIAISNTVVSVVREYAGRGPTKARTLIRDNLIVVMLEQSLTKTEQALMRHGRAEAVAEMRRAVQDAMKDDASARISALTGRTVVAMMSANHLDPDLAAEIFVLDGPPTHSPHGSQPGDEAG